MLLVKQVKWRDFPLINKIALARSIKWYDVSSWMPRDTVGYYRKFDKCICTRTSEVQSPLKWWQIRNWVRACKQWLIIISTAALFRFSLNKKPRTNLAMNTFVRCGFHCLFFSFNFFKFSSTFHPSKFVRNTITFTEKTCAKNGKRICMNLTALELPNLFTAKTQSRNGMTTTKTILNKSHVFIKC